MQTRGKKRKNVRFFFFWRAKRTPWRPGRAASEGESEGEGDGGEDVGDEDVGVDEEGKDVNALTEDASPPERYDS